MVASSMRSFPSPPATLAAARGALLFCEPGVLQDVHTLLGACAAEHAPRAEQGLPQKHKLLDAISNSYNLFIMPINYSYQRAAALTLFPAKLKNE